MKAVLRVTTNSSNDLDARYSGIGSTGAAKVPSRRHLDEAQAQETLERALENETIDESFVATTAERLEITVSTLLAQRNDDTIVQNIQWELSRGRRCNAAKLSTTQGSRVRSANRA